MTDKDLGGNFESGSADGAGSSTSNSSNNNKPQSRGPGGVGSGDFDQFNLALRSIVSGTKFQEQVRALREQGREEHARRQALHPDLYHAEQWWMVKRSLAVTGLSSAVGGGLWAAAWQFSLKFRARKRWQKLLMVGVPTYMLAYKPLDLYATQRYFDSMNAFPRSKIGDIDCPSVLYTMRQVMRLKEMLATQITRNAVNQRVYAVSSTTGITNVNANAGNHSDGSSSGSDSDVSAHMESMDSKNMAGVHTSDFSAADFEPKASDDLQSQYWKRVCKSCHAYMERVALEERTKGEVTPGYVSAAQKAMATPVVGAAPTTGSPAVASGSSKPASSSGSSASSSASSSGVISSADYGYSDNNGGGSGGSTSGSAGVPASSAPSSSDAEREARREAMRKKRLEREREGKHSKAFD